MPPCLLAWLRSRGLAVPVRAPRPPCHAPGSYPCSREERRKKERAREERGDEGKKKKGREEIPLLVGEEIFFHMVTLILDGDSIQV